MRPIELTKAGIALHRRAVVILAEVEGLRTDARRVNAAPLPLLRVALLASIATTLARALSVLARKTFGIPELSLFAGLATDHVACCEPDAPTSPSRPVSCSRSKA